MRFALAALLLLVACKKDAPPKPEEPAKPHLPKARADLAEVEISGDYSAGTTKPASVHLTVLDVPCLPVPKDARVMGQDVPTNSHFFLEIFVPQGTKGFICMYGLDAAGKVIAGAEFEKNPFLMQGQGEVEAHLQLELKAMDPVDPPAGLTVKKPAN
ncbi:MAG: hypothetical protein QM723_01105 [Myxococcaceae bacterium]